MKKEEFKDLHRVFRSAVKAGSGVLYYVYSAAADEHGVKVANCAMKAWPTPKFYEVIEVWGCQDRRRRFFTLRNSRRVAV